MVTERREGSLVDGGAFELLSEEIVAQHVENRVGLALQPKSITEASVACQVVRLAFASIDDNVVVPG